ncbi:MAG: DUF4390 domain-containing protein [Methylophilaceae bacterium]
MTASFMHFWKNPLFNQMALKLLGGALALLLSASVWAAGNFSIKEAVLIPAAESYMLNIDFDAKLGEEVEAALHKGVALNFLIEFKLSKPRKYWFDDEIASARQQVVLSYHALSRQYLIHRENRQKAFVTWQEAKDEFTHVRDWNVFSKESVKKGELYQAAVLIRLDQSRLPKPLQIEASSSEVWDLSSEPYLWQPSFTP